MHILQAVKKDSKQTNKYLESEIKIHSSVNWPFLVTMFDSFQVRPNQFVIFSFGFPFNCKCSPFFGSFSGFALLQSAN